MHSLNRAVETYTAQLQQGEITFAYWGILAFMSELRALLEGAHPDYTLSALYPGYLDMTYFACTPPWMKDRRLKIAIVYLHAEAKFELWLAAGNRAVQKEYIAWLSGRDTHGYQLTQAAVGVDAILIATGCETPDFDRSDALKETLKTAFDSFVEDVLLILS